MTQEDFLEKIKMYAEVHRPEMLKALILAYTESVEAMCTQNIDN